MSADASFFAWVSFIWQQNWPLFLRGAGNTLLISLTGTIIGFTIGIIIGVIRTIPVEQNANIIKKGILKVIDFLLLAYIEIFRGTPMMVQAMVLFYGTAMVFNVHLPLIGAGIFIVSINTGAYMAEIVRGGILSIEKGQFEAAHAIGMTHAQSMTSIILPQAIRNILPATSNEFVINIKDTSVLSIISISELFFMSKSAAGANFRYFETFLITCAVYFIMTFTVTRILRWVEVKLDGPAVFTIHGSQSVPEAQFRIVDGGK